MALEVPERPEAIREGPVAAPASESARRLDRLAPLIHELVAWDLVYRTDAGEFVLHDDVQHRLAELTALRHQPAAQLYIGRLCQRCGTVGVTRLLDGVHVCSACSLAERAEPALPVEPDPSPTRPETRSRWHRKAG